MATITLQTPDKQPDAGFAITPVYERLLIGDQNMPLGLYHFHLMTAAQLTRLHYSEGSVKHVKALLKVLVDHGYVQEDWTPTRLLRSPYLYMPTQRTIDYLRSELRWDLPDRLRVGKEEGKGYLHIEHEKGLNDVVISAALLKWHAPSYHLETFIHHRELGRNPYPTRCEGTLYNLVPDAFLELRKLLPNGRFARYPILLEHDRGSEQRKQFRHKIRAYIMMLKAQAYKDRFNVSTDSMTIAFTTFEGEKRREQLRAWTSEELQGEAQSLAASFLFTAQLRPPDPMHVWLTPCWYPVAMEAKPIALLAEG